MGNMLSAAATGLGALLAMPMLVLGAFLSAGPADFGAGLQQVRGMVRAAGHEAGSQGAHVGTVASEADATDHPLNIGFM